MRIVLIGNYNFDQQESMDRFASMLYIGFSNAGYECTIIRPKVLLRAPFHPTTLEIAKWLGYIDKWILFPTYFRIRLLNKQFNNSETYFHICDHSNAPYLRWLPSSRTSITCHDVLAIRGALGYEDAYCKSSSIGKFFQSWICKNLIKATKIVCISKMTLTQLFELREKKYVKSKNWKVIHLGFNGDFKPIGFDKAIMQLKDVEINITTSFILHVGSGEPRKNRKLLVDMLNIIRDSWNGKVYFAGKKVDDTLRDYINKLGLSDRVVSIVKPDHRTLVALYSICEAFIFPSYSEGFGWPLIEAQACGAPVIASNKAPMPEISDGTALHHDPDKPQHFVDAFKWLQNKKNRYDTIEKGLQNIKRFDPQIMIKSYLECFEEGDKITRT